MSIWKKLTIYGSYMIIAGALTLLLMGKNIRTQIFIGNERVDMFPRETVQLLTEADPGKVSTKGALIVGKNQLIALPSVLALPIFLGILPILFLTSAYIQLRGGWSMLKVLLVGIGMGVVIFIVIYTIPRAS